MEFYVNLGDWPLEHRKVNETPGPLPIISWCGSLDSQDVILPTYDITHSTLEALRGVTNDLLSIQGNTGKSHSLRKSLKVKKVKGMFTQREYVYIFK